ncbi:NUDIX hydrolase [Kitasatospora sp. A2-31]|uniref:NUDIX hydrolase n=1 Tax=Kitasatospora sp. A2-31 TaxID=2916414 RepID=UPI001EEC9C26|nr:NUDIX hydrolase [Kitasatospora sp. A2-31]MCG6494039.1 NUDIX hydrolase [Kitasatospora sp. A2-31]
MEDHATYRRLREDQPRLFDNTDAAIEIIDDLGPVGLMYSDDYIRVVRDPVRFPDGRVTGYVRILHSATSPPSVVLPCNNGDILLLEIYRHALRSWSLEAPRGFGTAGLTGAQNAAKELREELSAAADEYKPLGVVHPDSGLMSQSVELYLAEIPRMQSISVQAAEGIRSAAWLTPEEARDYMLTGRITDGFTIAAIALAQARRLL